MSFFQVSGVFSMVFSVSVLHASVAAAADTVEVFLEGPSDLEIYSGVEGLGKGIQGRAHFVEWVLGFGVQERVTAYVEGGLVGNGQLVELGQEWGAGVFSTLVDSDHVDWDFGLGGGSEGDVLAYSSFTELNLDAEPELALAGAYLNIGGQVFGRESVTGSEPVGFRADGILGGYLTIANGQQLHLEVDGSWLAAPRQEEAPWEIGSVHLGFNTHLTDAVELITELSADIPQRGEGWAMGGFLGFIATLGPVVAVN